MFVTLFGITIFKRLVQFKKEARPMILREFGRVMFCNEEQPEKEEILN